MFIFCFIQRKGSPNPITSYSFIMDKLVKTSLMVLFLTCSTILSAQTGRTTLKIVHYNVGVFSKEIENSIPMIAGMMKELDADVISLNELDSCNLRHDTYQLTSSGGCCHRNVLSGTLRTHYCCFHEKI